MIIRTIQRLHACFFRNNTHWYLQLSVLLPVLLFTTAPVAQTPGVSGNKKPAKNTAIYGTLHISSTPSNAKIFINGIETGYTTPSMIPNMMAGSNTIELSLPDYMFAKRQVVVIPDTIIILSFHLIALSDTLKIIGDLKLGILNLTRPPMNTPYLIDNKQIYSQEVTLNVGKHHVVWEGGDYFSSLDTIIDIQSGKLTVVNFTPQRLYGTITVIPEPSDADIFINNRLYGTGQLSSSLASGTYTVTVKRSGFFSHSQEVLISPREVNTVTLSLVLIPDKDGDGFLDSIDLCPDTYGLYSGCPKQPTLDAIKKYGVSLQTNLKEQNFMTSVSSVGFISRKPTNQQFGQFLSYFNDGSSFFNNINGLTFGNTGTFCYKGFIGYVELGQWYNGCEYKKDQFSPIVFKTGTDSYCLVYDTVARIHPTLVFPSTTLGCGMNLKIKQFNFATVIGFQWENIIVDDIITESNWKKYKLGQLQDFRQRYRGPRKKIVFRNNCLINLFKFEYDIIQFPHSVVALHSSFSMTIGLYEKTGWSSIQMGICHKYNFDTEK